MTESERLEGDNAIADRFQQAADTIHDNYKFTGTVNASMKMQVNALYDPAKMYERANPDQIPV